MHNGETEYEMVAQIQDTSVDLADKDTGAIDWEAVQAASSVTESRCTENIPYLCNIVQMYGGGKEGRFVKKIGEFVQTAVPDNRRIPGHIWRSIANLQVDSSTMAPYVVWAILKAEAMCPKEHVSNGVTEYFSPASVSMLPVKQKRR